MTERALVELLRGKGAHVDPVACIEDLSCDLASRQMNEFPHSVGQLVWHMNYWMEYELRRIRSERPAYPEHASESFPPAPFPTDPGEWQGVVRRFSALIHEFEELAESSAPEQERQIESVQPGDKMIANSFSSILWQMVAHNSYHAGQIALIRRAMGAWPPRGGGDTW